MLKKICKELGIEIGEEWIGNDGKTYMVENGRILEYYEPENYSGTDYEGWVVSGDEAYADILQNRLRPIWQPEDREKYYYPEIAYNTYYGVSYWNNGSVGKARLERGIVFKTKEEAIEVAEKMLRAVKEE